MQTIISNFLHATAMNVEASVVWALVIAYVMLVATTIASIWCSKIGRAYKLFWSLLVMACPFFGVIVYCVRCLMRADYSILTQIGFSKKKSPNKVRPGTKNAEIMS